MRQLSVNPVAALALALWISSANGDDDRFEQQRQHGNANQTEYLVRNGLAAGLVGDAEGRRAKLEAALAADGDSAAPRWHLGYVRVGDTWKTVAEAEDLARADKKLNAYVLRQVAHTCDPAH